MFEGLAGGLASAAASLYGGSKARKAQKKANAANLAMQLDMAKNAIRYKVQDAKNAGVHPLFALGASTQSFTPSQQPVTDGSQYSQAGQAIQGALDSYASRKERDKALALERSQMTLEMMKSLADARKTSAEADYWLSQAAASDDMRSQARNNITQDTKAQSEYDTGVGGVPLGKYQQVKQLESEYGQEGADAVGLARLFKELTLTFGWNLIVTGKHHLHQCHIHFGP